MLELYSEPLDTVYDPFAGHNSRMELTYSYKRNYIGVDISEKFMAANNEVKEFLINNTLFGSGAGTIDLIVSDSKSVKGVKTNTADFSMTSPPYWDIEYYGDEAEQLGSVKTYAEFLENLYAVIKEVHRILKPGKFCCWCINDFIKNKIFYAYHIDVYALLVKAGFVPHFIYIVDLQSSLQEVFAAGVIAQKRLPKVHEYALVFKKPAEQMKIKRRKK